jgi:vancomycin resistance protein VanJ
MKRLRLLFGRLLSRRAGIAAALMLLLLLALRITLRDRIVGLSGLFYLTPFPAQAAAWVGLAGILAAQKRFRWAAASMAAVASCSALWVSVSWVFNSRTANGTENALQLTCWNAARAKNPKAVEKAVLQTRPDICALIEAGTAVISAERWKELFGPEYDALRLPGGMMIIVRGKVLPFDHEDDYRTAGRRARYAAVSVEVSPKRTEASTETLTLILCDIHSCPFYDKSIAFAKLRDVIDQCGSADPIVLGDFNTPLESVYFRELERDGFSNAFLSAGNGFAETWGFGLPIVAIDQVWTKGTWRATHAEHESWKGSDHRPVQVLLDRQTPRRDDTPD